MSPTNSWRPTVASEVLTTPLCAITVQAVDDLGYQVDPDRAEPYEIQRAAAKVVPSEPRWRCGGVVGVYEAKTLICRRGWGGVLSEKGGEARVKSVASYSLPD